MKRFPMMLNNMMNDIEIAWIDTAAVLLVSVYVLLSMSSKHDKSMSAVISVPRAIML